MKRTKISPQKTDDLRQSPLPSSQQRHISTTEPAGRSFPVVGIGASAGGLEAFEKFFTHMPPDSGMAFVLVQHLSAPHKSILDDLVQRLTQMKVYAVDDGITVQQNCVYIIPPNKDMALLHGKLHLLEPGAARGLRLPIDYFFRSLAQDQQERAIGIVLSGTGSDGSLGLKAIKEKGGMVMAHDPQTAKYDGMPRSAINTGLVDYILPPEKMPEQLLSYVGYVFGGQIQPVAHLPETANLMEKIFILLRAQIGHDFSGYKQNTIRRRIERRMAVNQIGQMKTYVRYLQDNPLEVVALFEDILIGVTNFFRDPEAFTLLETQVIPELLKNRSAQQPVRVWVAGCSTGEEAYSIAILLREQMDAMKQDFKVQIFATDIDKNAIEKARAGIYPRGIIADVSPERLRRFFSQIDTAYQIKKSIRDMVIFAEQNVIVDPPFSNMDWISCRNLLIYLGSDLQKQVIPLFHYSLCPKGILFLGNSEGVGEFADLFTAIDRKWKLYQRKGEPIRYRPLPTTTPRPPFMDDIIAPHLLEKVDGNEKISLREVTERTLLQQFTPACVIINKKAEILFIHGLTGKYLEPAQGEANLNIIQMAREGIRLELTSAIRKAIAQNVPIHHTGLQIQMDGQRQTLDLTVQPILEPPNMRGLLMILFQNSVTEMLLESGENIDDPDTETIEHSDPRIIQLEQELNAKEEYLQTAIEELEVSSEDLKSTNEELQSANEELQSTNEELETSKEELQSMNEELITVNAEHQGKIEELSRANNDMNNLLAGTGVGTIFVDHQLRIRRFTPSATQVINLIPSDIGRPLNHISSNLTGLRDLAADIQSVLDTLMPIETQVQAATGQWYMMRIMPYRTTENVIEGVVMTFTDITRLEENLQASEARYQAIFEQAADPVVVMDIETGALIEFNDKAHETLGYSRDEFSKLRIIDFEVAEPIEDVARYVERLVAQDDFETKHKTKAGAIRDVRVSSRKITLYGKAFVLSLWRDITEDKKG